jgi:hypothetical protein
VNESASVQFGGLKPRIIFYTNAHDIPARQARLLRILRDIPPVVLQLSVTPDDVVKELVHPQRTSTTQQAVDLKRAAAFPMTQNLPKRDLPERRNQGVKMVWHDAPGVQMISRAGSREKTTFQASGTLRLGEHALAVASIEQCMKSGGVFAVEKGSVGFREVIGG